MKTFAYKGFNRAGGAERGFVEALSTRDAREKLAAAGILAERISPADSRAARPGAARREFSRDVRAACYRELGALLRAGLTLVKALDVLIDSPEMAAARRVLAGVRDRIKEGDPLARSLAAMSRRVTPMETSAIEAGERSGTLEEVLDRLGVFLEEQSRVAERLATALIYPCIVVGFAVCLAVAMLGFVLPSAARVLAENRVPMPPLTRTVIAAGRLALWAAAPLLAVGVAAAVAARRRAAASAAFRARADRALFRMPVAGRAYLLLVNLRFARTFALLLRGGIPLVDGLQLAARATGSAWVQERVVEQAEAVRHGCSLADALRRVAPLAESLPGWIQAGEAGGQLERLLDSVGDWYQRRWDRFVTRAMSVGESLLVLAVGAFVLLIALSILMPILSFNRLMQ